MSTVGQRERLTQQQVLRFFQSKLGYRYLGDWKDRAGNRNIEAGLLRDWLTRQGHDERLINRALRELDQAAATSSYALSQSCASIFAGPVVKGANA